MATTIAEYYTDELEEWNRQLTSYGLEMLEMENKLSDVIRRNTIPGIAAKVEHHQDSLDKLSMRFDRLQLQFQQQEKALKTDDRFIDDTQIADETGQLQDELRQQMQQSEKEYIEVKHDCSNFLSDIFRKRND